MDINNLKAFIEVADKRSFSRSAETLHLTQPAVSKRIAALETELSARLFDRVGRSVHLTEAGKVLLPSARQISAELDRIEDVICNMGKGVSGKLSIGTSSYIGVHRLPTILKNFRSAYPDVVIDIHFGDSTTAMQSVEDGLFEIGLCAMHSTAESHLKESEIWNDDLVIVVSRDHPLTEEQQPDIELLMKCPAVLPSLPSATRKTIDSALSTLNTKAAVSMEAHDLETVKTMASIGLGWACIPKVMVDDSLTILQIPGFNIKRRISLIRHHDRTLSRAAEAFIEALPNNGV
ncbi:hypothetical protein AB833_06875 [Chromatiales bacterium (ex Bugula neritina AB1)]|nr:hypothetical protein AB833_06875 [Chromatiales bacterium (ex Bugula neritina AB1)]